ncbi:hypothetical protein [Deinococcus hopiensis]|uniref:hypothetical protein n=1 Tax=Deinococcus hopiensis TaxID=309885 RepID=UPI000A020812|nr:hypothetical protein [Deinococcus hopiensis]
MDDHPQPHLVWLDIRMSDLDGFSTVKQLREEDAVQNFPQRSLARSTHKRFRWSQRLEDVLLGIGEIVWGGEARVMRAPPPPYHPSFL